MTGLDSTNVAWVYVSAGTAPTARGSRSPTRRAKSTVMGDYTSCGELLAPVSVIELMLRLRLTTDGSGASSPVTKTAPACGFVERVAPPPPQPTTVRPHMARSIESIANRFMTTPEFLKSRNSRYQDENPLRLEKLRYFRTEYQGNSRSGRGFERTPGCPVQALLWRGFSLRSMR